MLKTLPHVTSIRYAGSQLPASGGNEVYTVALRDEIRIWVLVEGHSQRSAARHFGVTRDTVTKLLAEPAEPRERRYQRAKPVQEAALPHIQGWLQENAHLQRWAPKQRWTARRMWQELHKQGIAIGESTVRQLVREQRQERKPAYLPLEFAPGERAEFDFGHAQVNLNGQVVQLPFLAGRLRFSGAMFVELFPTERQEAFLLGQRHAFEFWGGVPRMAVYDNLKPAVLKILQGHRRVEQEAFRHFHSVYRFEALFASVRAGWEKGSVENQVGYARRTYLVPIPEANNLEALNERLRADCRHDQQRVMAGRRETIAARLEVERAQLGPLPAHPLDIGAVREVIVRSTSRVRFEGNDYSVPVRYAYQRLTLKADPFRVRLYAGAEVIADHPRSYDKGQAVEDWRHYVPLLLEKPFALPWVSALRQGALPEAWERARQELVARRSDGNHEFARLLELCLTHPVAAVEAALVLAHEQPAWSADTVRQLLGWAQAPTTVTAPLDPATYPDYQVALPAPNVAAYNQLLEVRP
jgi:transposase